ncbi:MAG TPA: T9SS type A sorting domain-containing protein [Saprospiraceae bacterium]|nr:T9SS type A sorting domain-containing protein [Saprospiraceae bacterium]
MKLSIQLIGALLFVVCLRIPLEAKTTFPIESPHLACDPPGIPVVSGITSVSALLTWTAPAIPVISYEWKLVATGASPESAGLAGGISTDTFELVTGLAAELGFDVYVRSVCLDDEFSEWTGPVNFFTSPGCGDFTYDSGGPLGEYQDGEKTVTTICPDLITNVVTIDFTEFVLAAGDTLQIFDGTSVTDYLIRNFTQENTPPFTVSATNLSGCLTLRFSSDLNKVDAGWKGAISCAIPSECFKVQSVSAFNLQATSANFSWPAVFGAFGYQWDVQNLDGTPVSSGIATGTSINVGGLIEGTEYHLILQTLCISGESDLLQITFYTPIRCDNKPSIICGQNVVSASTGQGIWQTDACGDMSPTPGREKLYRFTAPQTRRYTFQTIGGSSPVNAYATYAYKEVSEGCGPYDWHCIGSFLVTLNSVSTTFGPLVAGKEYLILFDPETTAYVQHGFKIKDCEPPNDEARNAVTLALDSPCVGNIYSNKDATFNIVDSLGIEPNPDTLTDNEDPVSGRWLTSADQTVWFKFKAPSSGSVIISTESLPLGANFDTQLALYETPDSANYTKFRLIASDDDNGVGGLGYNSIFSYSGLTPGKNYYIQVDGYGSIISGTFCLEVREGVIRFDEAECAPGYFAEHVDGLAPDGDRWYDVYSRPDELDLGDLLIAVKPGLQDLDTVFCRTSVADTIPVSLNVIPYLPAYYSISSSKPPTEPYTVRLFFHNAEFDSLVVKSDLDPEMVSINDLVATHYAGPNEDCFQKNNSILGVPTLITDIKAVSMGLSNMFYVELQIPGDGEIGIHLKQVALPVELRSFTGEIADGINRLKWTTETEKNVAWHILERSADGSNWKEMYRQAGQVGSNSPTDYVFDDVHPLQKSYYRLRTTDLDGQAVLSSIVVLTRQDVLGIDKVYPSPTTDRLHINFTVPGESELQIHVTDITGKIVLEQQISASKGRQSTFLSLQSLPAGVYLLSMNDGSTAITPVRIVKQ